MKITYLLICLTLLSIERGSAQSLQSSYEITFAKGIKRNAKGTLFKTEYDRTILAIPHHHFISEYRNVKFKSIIPSKNNILKGSDMKLIMVPKEVRLTDDQFVFFEVLTTTDSISHMPSENSNPKVEELVYVRVDELVIKGRIVELDKNGFVCSFNDQLPELSGLPLFNNQNLPIGTIYYSQGNIVHASSVRSLSNRINSLSSFDGSFQYKNNTRPYFIAGIAILGAFFMQLGQNE